jgi:hypothetical protein
MADQDRGGEVTIPGAGGGPVRPVPPERAANAGPVAEDDVTEWLASAGAPSSSGPPPPGPWWPRTPVLACTVIAALVIGALGAAAFRHYTRPPGGNAAASRLPAVRDEAASWVARQVSRDATVSCDQVMCTALTAHGFPARGLMVLGPTSPAPKGSDVVVETHDVRTLFGSNLDAAWAPAVLASFGSGTDRITVRVIAPNGAAVYQVLLGADLAARKAAGTALLRDRRIAVPAAAAGQLAGGMVDARLLRALASLARQQPIAIVGFGNAGPGASAGIPLRFADLAETDRAARLSGTAYVRSARAYLSTVRARFHLTPVTTVTPPHGPPVLRLQVTAPSPLG